MPLSPLEPAPPEAVPPLELAPGTRLGAKYEIVRRLATGGMAEILLARVVGLLGFQKEVVIKRILPHLATQSDFIEMFLNEARIATTLQHPNIVQMYEVGICDKNYFIAMEYLDGEDLRSILSALAQRGRRMPLEHAVYIISSIAAGLHYAHEKRDFDGRRLEIVHRDATPQNVIVTRDGGIKLLDFGVAKASNSFSETRNGTLKGKVPYMSPEQCRGDHLDRRSDVFSLGIMLYESTLGRRLFKGKSDFEVLKAIVEGPVPRPRELDPDYPLELERIVLRALEKEREQRYPTARDLQADLEAFARDERLPVSGIALSALMGELFVAPAAREDSVEIEIGPSVDPELAPPPDDGQETPAGWSPGPSAAPTASLHPAIPGSPVLEFAPDDLSEPRPLVAPRRPRRVGLMLGGGALALFAAAWGLWWSTSGAPPAPSAASARSARPARTGSAVPAARSPAPTTTDPGVAPDPTRPTAPATEDAPPQAPVTEHAAAAPKSSRADRKHPHRSRRVERSPSSTTTTSVEVAPPDPPPAPPPALTGSGILILASSPWCNVSVDGKPLGTTPLQAKLPAGRHQVLLTNDEFKIRRKLAIDVLPDQTVRKRLDFAP